MADIKTKEVTRGTIKTIDRAASSMHHLKEETIRSKSTDIGSSRESDSAGSYAQDAVGRFAGDSTAYAMHAGVELMLRSRRDKTGETAGSGRSDENIQRAFREQGIKDIRTRQARSKMADMEAERTAESFKNTGRIRGAAGTQPEDTRRIRRRTSAAIRTAGKDDPIQKQRRQHAIDRIISRQSARTQNLIMMFRRSSRSERRTATVTNSFIRYIWAHSRNYILTLGAGGIAAVIILTLFVIFGIGTITLSNNGPETGITENQEEIEYFIPDLAGSPTRVAMVKAAARELGNVGGEKFWRWYGFKSHVHWCACFTSYIATECGCIQAGICPRSALVDDWIRFYKKQHRWAGRDYIPHTGDFIIFDWEGDGSPDHIGIVESCDGKTVHTIEGNSRDVCRRKTYTRGSGLIYGYGLPAYSEMQ